MFPKKPVLILDLHNTLYDEVMEYGGAIKAAISFLLEKAKEQGISIDRNEIMKELSSAHRKADSDWDDDCWKEVEELKKLENATSLIEDAIDLRIKTSKQLTQEYAYKDTIAVLRTFKENGAYIVVATEATADAAANAVRWLGLDGIIDIVYSWPYRKPYKKLEETLHRSFPFHPAKDELFLQKPHPYILGKILFDYAKQQNAIPQQLEFDEIYDRSLEEKNVERTCFQGNSVQVRLCAESIQTKLLLKNSPYKEDMQDIHKRAYYIGDSFFKDGFLAKNASIPFVYAEYGKKTMNPSLHEEAKSILYAVTGWEPSVLQLTQEASMNPALTEKIKPYFTCKESLREFLDFLSSPSGNSAPLP
jgi:phosphoglycolate phosphatase-like HAD superfamily hydrolase